MTIEQQDKEHLQHIVDELLSKDHQRIQSFEYKGNKYWLKCAEKTTGWMRILKGNPKKSIQNEIEILQFLNSKNAPVSELILHGEDYCLLSDVGETMNVIFHRDLNDMETISAMLIKCSQGLATLHNMGLYHGRPAIRDIAWDGEMIRFIDFEGKNKTDNVEYNQEKDLLIYIHNLYRSKYLDQKTIDGVLKTYREATGDKIWDKCVERIHRLRVIYYILKPFKNVAGMDLLAGIKLCEQMLFEYDNKHKINNRTK